MIELGKIQVLEVVRESDFGVYLNSKEEKSEKTAERASRAKRV